MKLQARIGMLCGMAAFWWFSYIGQAWAVTSIDQLNYQDPVPVAPPSMGGMLLRLILSLVIVIGLVFVLVKFLQKSTLLTRQSPWARVIDQVAIGQGKMLVLVEIFGKVSVLAVTDHSITTLLDEQQIDLSQVQQLVSETGNNNRIIPFAWEQSFRQVLESKIADVKRWRAGKPGD